MWKNKIPLSKVMDGTADGRSISGLKKAVHRLASSGLTTEACMLKNYLKHVLLAQQLSPQSVGTLSTGELHAMVATMVGEEATLPGHLKALLVTRRVSDLMEKKKDEELMIAISPFEVGEFDSLNPKLGCLQDTMGAKLVTFQNLIFKEIIVNRILQGAHGANHLLSFAKVCMHFFDHLDILDLDNLQAAALHEAVEVWKFIVAMCTVTLDTSYEAPLAASMYHSLAVVVFCIPSPGMECMQPV
jgi:hypothetical protein